MDAEAHESVSAGQQVNQGSYLAHHSAQMFTEGRSFSGYERDKVFFGDGEGGFVDLSGLSHADSPNDGRAVIAADFDGDLDVDLFVHNIQRERHNLFRNELGGTGLALRLRATTGQWEAIGATVIVEAGERRAAQVMTRGAGFTSCQVPELLFGLGDSESARVSVRWPGGALEDFGTLAAGSQALLVEGAGEAELQERRTGSLPDPLPPGLAFEEGDLVPAFAALDGEGETVAVDVRELADGKPLYLNFWGSFCAPCIAEMPDLQALHDGGEARVVAVSTDAPAGLGRARSILAERDISFPAYYLGAAGSDGLEPLEEWLDLDRLKLPTTVVVSPEGRVEAILTGPLGAGR